MSLKLSKIFKEIAKKIEIVYDYETVYNTLAEDII